MKKLFLAVLALAMAVNANAKFGIIGGVTSTRGNLSDAVADIRNLTQFHAGVAYKIPIGAFAIQPAIQYNVKGTKLEAITGIGDLDFKTGYLEMPIQLQYGLDLAVVRPYVFLEPFLGYAVYNNVRWNDASGSISDSGWDNVKKRFEWGIGIGLGAEFIKHLQVSIRYFWNFGNVYSTSIGSVAKTIESGCSGISASLGVFF